MANYFKNIYDPSLEEMQQVFPDYNYGTKESWLEHFQNMYPSNPIKQAKFAFKKLNDVTTSYKMDEFQKNKLLNLISEGKAVNTNQRLKYWETYCSILTPKQMGYVGY
jgi:hypothetical protein